MLHINKLSYRIDGRLILEEASCGIPTGHKVGLVGRNGAGKTTLLRLLTGEIAPEAGTIMLPKSARIGHVAQEAPGGRETLIDWVLAADTERAALLSEAATATDPTRIADIQIRLSDIGAHSAPARAARILSGLGFDQKSQQQACGEFSGGWRMRVALAAVLFLEPDLLLLDEPTNYLDLEGSLWLEGYLRNYPHTVLIVSHDRNLLNQSVGAILNLENKKLTLYSGGYDVFEETRRLQQQIEAKLKRKQDEERRRIAAFVDRFRAKASKATQAQSRLKMLARMQPIAARSDEQVHPFSFPAPAKVIASPLIQIENASVGYAPDRPILSQLNLRIDNDDRIALLGQNGNGKSTFAKLLCQRLKATSGTVKSHKDMTFGYFAQHQLDELDSTRTPYDYIRQVMPDATEAQRRGKLGAIGFGFEKADNFCKTLSGGEKARLLLFLATFHGPHILILDEPTNHLDVDSRQALIQAINDFQGAVIIISHDRHIIDACADRLWVVRKGTVGAFDGDLDDYRVSLFQDIAESKRETPSKEPSTSSGAELGRAEQRRAAANLRLSLAPLKKELVSAEKEVADLSDKIARLDEELADSSIFQRDPQQAQQLAKRRGGLVKRLKVAEDDWMVAMEAYEAAEAAGTQT
ncbi:MAG: ABC-F family ATP-binding cassette domain-containing protein [Hyphomicrobiaceae bacterium]